MALLALLALGVGVLWSALGSTAQVGTASAVRAKERVAERALAKLAAVGGSAAPRVANGSEGPATREPTPIPEAAAPEPAPLGRFVIEGLIGDLAHDDVKGNASRAVYRLVGAEEEAEPFLRDALRSRDRQQRQLAGVLLMRAGMPADALLFDVAIEALEHDGINHRQDVAVSNAGYAMEYLFERSTAAREHLVGGLVDGDRQRQLACAYLLARAGDEGSAERVASILVEHLADNDICGDALVASAGLFRMGDAAEPALARAALLGDAQTRDLVEAIRLERCAPAHSRDELLARREFLGASTSFPNPPRYDARRLPAPPSIPVPLPAPLDWGVRRYAGE